MVTKTVYKEVEVEIDVDLSDFSDEDLIAELNFRGINNVNTSLQHIEKLYKSYTNNGEINYRDLRDFCAS